MSDSPVHRVSSLCELAGTIPALFGFHPTNSLIVISLKRLDGQLRMGPLARMDLPPATRADVEHAAAQYVPHVRNMVRQGYADAVVLVFFTDEITKWEPLAGLLSDFIHGTAADVLDVLHVHAGLIGSYPFPEQPLAPFGGQGGLAVAAESAYQGRATLPDRDTLRRSLDTTTAVLSAAQMNDACQAMQTAADPTSDTSNLYRHTIELAKAGNQPAATDAAKLIAAVALSNIVRDEIIYLVIPDSVTHDSAAVLAALTHLVQISPTHYIPAITTILAIAAYRAGQGALTNVALDRVLHIDPQYRLAGLLRQASDSMTPPEVLDAMLAADLP